MFPFHFLSTILIITTVFRLEAEFSSLDACVKTHEQQLKEFAKLGDMLKEVEKENGSRSDLFLSSKFNVSSALCQISIEY